MWDPVWKQILKTTNSRPLLGLKSSQGASIIQFLVVTLAMSFMAVAILTMIDSQNAGLHVVEANSAARELERQIRLMLSDENVCAFTLRGKDPQSSNPADYSFGSVIIDSNGTAPFKTNNTTPTPTYLKRTLEIKHPFEVKTIMTGTPPVPGATHVKFTVIKAQTLCC